MSNSEGQLIDAAEIAAPFREEIKKIIEGFPDEKRPKLVGFLANDDPAAKMYADWTGKACERDGIRYELRIVEKDDLETELRKANEDKEVHGIMIYYPVFGDFPCFYGGTMDEFLRDSISVTKDVEGLCHMYRTYLYRNIRYMEGDTSKKCVLPCTPLAIVKALEHLQVYDNSLPLGNRMAGKQVTVINRSDIVGRPLAAMLANDGAEVYSADINSVFIFRRGKIVESKVSLEEAVRGSAVVVTGVPTKNYKLNSDWISPNTVIINVASFNNVEKEEILKIPGVKYIPRIGKVTVAMLERNIVRLFNNYHA